MLAGYRHGVGPDSQGPRDTALQLRLGKDGPAPGEATPHTREPGREDGTAGDAARGACPCGPHLSKAVYKQERQCLPSVECVPEKLLFVGAQRDVWESELCRVGVRSRGVPSSCFSSPSTATSSCRWSQQGSQERRVCAQGVSWPLIPRCPGRELPPSGDEGLPGPAAWPPPLEWGLLGVEAESPSKTEPGALLSVLHVPWQFCAHFLW